MARPNFNVDMGALSVLGLMVSHRLIEVLREKELLTLEESAEVFRKALNDVGESQREAARNILKLMVPEIRV